MKKRNFKDFKKNQISGELFQHSKTLVQRLKSAKNPKTLLQIYDSNKLQFDTEMYLDFFKHLAIMLPGWTRFKKDLFL